ncbi:MAG: glycerol-3-phosphate 1-O-acyltransferase PlsY [Bacilli bacterium]
MEITLFILGIIVFAYLFGSIPTAIIFGKIKGVDVRKYGSHNAGGTNVGRVIGKKEGLMVIILDIFKCFIPCLITKLIFDFAPLPAYDFPHLDEILVNLTGLVVAIGHTFPVFAHFKGGKAVACFAGYILFTAPLLAFVGMSVFFLTFAISKRVSLSSVIGVPSVFVASLIPTILDLTIASDPAIWNGGMIFAPSFFLHISYVTSIGVLLYTILVIIRHSSNIKRLSKGQEPETKFKHKNQETA